MPGTLALRFDIDLSGGHANNYLVQNVSRALVSKQVVKFGGTTLEDIVDCDIYKIFTDLFLPEETCGNMVAEGIQSKKLSRIRSGAGDKPTTGVDAENKVDSQRRSMKGILLLFVEPYNAGTRDSEKYGFPDLDKVSVTINGSPNMLYNNGIESEDAWRQASRFFMKRKHKPQHMTLQFGLLIDLRSMASQQMHGSGTRLVNTTDGVQLEIKRKTGKGPFNCHIFVISDAQFNIQNRQLVSVMY